MCKAVKCPQCGHEFTPERAIKSGTWTPAEASLKALRQACSSQRKNTTK